MTVSEMFTYIDPDTDVIIIENDGNEENPLVRLRGDRTFVLSRFLHDREIYNIYVEDWVLVIQLVDSHQELIEGLRRYYHGEET